MAAPSRPRTAFEFGTSEANPRPCGGGSACLRCRHHFRAPPLRPTAYCEGMAQLSHGEIDRLGKRLRDSVPWSADDISMYMVWSAGFSDAMHQVRIELAKRARQADAPDSVGARIKQVDSIAAKLRRMPETRLSRLEDIAGCRIVVPTRRDVERLLAQCTTLNISRVRDYRDAPNNSYRAVHLIVRMHKHQPVEVQLRTQLQDLWANLTERCAILIDHRLKYGGGPVELARLLEQMSTIAARIDEERARIYGRRAVLSGAAGLFDRLPEPSEQTAAQLDAEEEQVNQLVDDFRQTCENLIRTLERKR